MNPTPYTWPERAQLALSVVVNVEEGSEATIADGDRGPEVVDELGVALKRAIRNYGNESNYRYGINRGAGRILELLDSFGVRATFTAAAGPPPFDVMVGDVFGFVTVTWWSGMKFK